MNQNETLNTPGKRNVIRQDARALYLLVGESKKGLEWGKIDIRMDVMSSDCFTVRKSRLLWRLSGTFCNASSAGPLFTDLTSRCTRQNSNVM